MLSMNHLRRDDERAGQSIVHAMVIFLTTSPTSSATATNATAATRAAFAGPAKLRLRSMPSFLDSFYS